MLIEKEHLCLAKMWINGAGKEPCTIQQDRRRPLVPGAMYGVWVLVSFIGKNNHGMSNKNWSLVVERRSHSDEAASIVSNETSCLIRLRGALHLTRGTFCPKRPLDQISARQNRTIWSHRLLQILNQVKKWISRLKMTLSHTSVVECSPLSPLSAMKSYTLPGWSALHYDEERKGGEATKW